MRAEEIERALEGLADLLTEQGVTCDIQMVGGAVMVWHYHARQGTADVDASFPEQRVAEAVKVVADQQGLPADWLNTKATMFFPHSKEPEWELHWARGSVTVYRASARSLLAMKLLAARVVRDGPDIEFLLEELSITEYDVAVGVFDEFYGQEVMSDRSRKLLKAALDANARRREGSVSQLLEVPESSEPDIARISSNLRGRWFVAERDTVRHVVADVTNPAFARMECGEVLPMGKSRMGKGRPIDADWCGGCLPRQ
ncbi:MAG: hypothetical protein ACRDWE_00260 [Acidimicrobiales bacterium]